MHPLPLRSVLTPAFRGRNKAAGPEEPGLAGAVAALEVYKRSCAQQAEKSMGMLNRLPQDLGYLDDFSFPPEEPTKYGNAAASPMPNQGAEQGMSFEDFDAFLNEADDQPTPSLERGGAQQTAPSEAADSQKVHVVVANAQVRLPNDTKRPYHFRLDPSLLRSGEAQRGGEGAPPEPPLPAAAARAAARRPEAAEADFDFSGDGRPYRFARGRASRVRGGREGVQLAKAQLCGAEPMELGLHDGTLRHVGPLSPIAGLGVSGILTQAELRPRFRDFVVTRIEEALASGQVWWGETGLRYLSFGAGELLFDVELLERIRLLGVRISQVCLIDPEYAEPSAGVKQALREFADWQSASALVANEAPPEVLAFGSIGDFCLAASDDGGRATSCHLFLQCDPFVQGAEDSKAAAARALATGGLFSRLASEIGPLGESLSADAWVLLPGPPEGAGEDLPTLVPVEHPLLAACSAAAFSTPSDVLAQVRERTQARLQARLLSQDAQRVRSAAAGLSPPPAAQADAGRVPAQAAEQAEATTWSKAEMRARGRLLQAKAKARPPPPPSPASLLSSSSQQPQKQQPASASEPAPEPPEAAAAEGGGGFPAWRVVFAPHVAVRSGARNTASIVGVLYTAEQVCGELVGEWIRITSGPERARLPKEAWVLQGSASRGEAPMLKQL